MKEKKMENKFDTAPYVRIQEQLRNQVVKKDQLPKVVRYIAGTDVAYDEAQHTMVGAFVILDAVTLEVVEQAHHLMEITFPYIPGLFSFREIPALREAYKKLKIKPDLVVCDAQGIAHPKGVGMATHLGIELDVPTIGCAKKRLVGEYDRAAVGNQRGDIYPLMVDGHQVGAALRTQKDIKPMFVSIGHKVSLATAIDWVLKLTPKYRLPETTRQADQLVNRLRAGE